MHNGGYRLYGGYIQFYRLFGHLLGLPIDDFPSSGIFLPYTPCGYLVDAGGEHARDLHFD